MTKSKVLKEAAVVLGITEVLWAILFLAQEIWSDFPEMIWERGYRLSWWLHLLLPYQRAWFIFGSILLSVLFSRVLLIYTSKLKWKYAAGLLALVLSVLAGFWSGRGVDWIYMREKLEPHWQTHHFNSFYFTLESPSPLKVWHKWEYDSSGKEADIRNFDTRGIMIHSQIPSLVDISFTCKEYKNQEPSLKKIENEVLKNNNLWHEKVKTSFTTFSGIPALLIDSDEGRYRKTVVVKGEFEWEWSVSGTNFYDEYYHADTQKMVDRIIQSIKIEDPA